MYKKIVIACAVLVLAALLFLISAFVAGIVSPPPVDGSAAAVIEAIDPIAGSAASSTPAAKNAVEAPKALGAIAGTIEVDGARYAAEIRDGTVYDLMEAARSKGFVFETEYHSGLGFFITSIGGVKNDPGNGRYWTLYVNGERSGLGASNYMLKSGDSVEWKLEKN